MTRIEEIEKASNKYRKSREICGVKDPILLDEVDDAFFMGAIWADKHTIHYNAQEMDYVLHKGVKRGKKEMLEKAIEWLRNETMGLLLQPKENYELVQEFVDSFKEAMEDK